MQCVEVYVYQELSIRIWIRFDPTIDARRESMLDPSWLAAYCCIREVLRIRFAGKNSSVFEATV